MVLPIRGKRRALLFLSYYLVHRSFHNWTVYELLSGRRLFSTSCGVGQPCPSSPPTALLLCLGVNIHDSGAGPRNISEIFTQSRLSPLARKVSFAWESETVSEPQGRCTYRVDRVRGREEHGR